jgi:hypothetical protein
VIAQFRKPIAAKSGHVTNIEEISKKASREAVIVQPSWKQANPTLEY